MAVKVRDQNDVVRTLPEVSEVGGRIDLKVGNEKTRAEAAEGSLQTAVKVAQSAAEVAQTTAESAGTSASQAKTVASAADTKASNAQTRVGVVEQKIPTQASSANQLADKNFVNSSIEQSAANRVTSNAQGDGFATRAALKGASTFYHGGLPYVPKKQDYALVLADEGAPAPFTRGQTRFEYDGTTWDYAYGINDRPFTAAERAAMESGATKELIDKIAPLEGEVKDMKPVYYALQEGDWTNGG